ncbi:YuzB family protein [Paenibacillus sp. HN-1]|uniref:YuzB family protein n=1 Tax=Paenibacillus TaxID=44249 RepID=UPI001CA9D86A|nr:MULTISPECIES: YuzB family protein [Paenibacillus]MBY9078855.1 YuzB family protein [Paenibacillus sp. CGMCC 1.18879]MBY9082841.1 YuzB family protein [Paenibacillus sinensis]
MRPIIEFCVSNLGHGTEELKKKLEQNHDYDVVEYGCLDNCEQCFFEPFALVNGEIIAAGSAEELEEAILAKIKEFEAWNNLEID